MPHYLSILIAACLATITFASHANFQYITMKAKAHSAINLKKFEAIEGKAAGIGNINFGPGTRIKNVTIINNSNNKGAAAIGGR